MRLTRYTDYALRVLIYLGLHSVGAVVRVMEGLDRMADCDACVIAPACGLANALDEAREAFVASLDAVSLEDVGRRGGALRRLVGAD